MSAPTIEYRDLVALAALLGVLWLLARAPRWLAKRDAAARLAERHAREDARYEGPKR